MCLEEAARAKGADGRILAFLFDMAQLPAIAALCGRGRRVGASNNTILAIVQGKGMVFHLPAMFSSDQHHHQAGKFPNCAGLAIRVEVVGFFEDKDCAGVDRGGEGGSSVPTRELAGCDCRRCTEKNCSSILSPKVEPAWIVDRRNGSIIASSEESVWQSFEERESMEKN